LLYARNPVLRCCCPTFWNQRPGASASLFRRTWHSLLGGRIAPRKTIPYGPLIRFYDPVVRWTPAPQDPGHRRRSFAGCSHAALVWKLGSEFMPPLVKALCSTCQPPCQAFHRRSQKLLPDARTQILKSFPEVDHVLGKTAALIPQLTLRRSPCWRPSSVLKPQSEWRPKQVWYSSWARLSCCRPLRRQLPPTRFIGRTHGANGRRPQNPGPFQRLDHAIRGRTQMLTPVSAPRGTQNQGADLRPRFQEIGRQIEGALRGVSRARATVFSERSSDGYSSTWSGTRELSPATTLARSRPASLVHRRRGENVSTVIAGQERFPSTSATSAISLRP